MTSWGREALDTYVYALDALHLSTEDSTGCFLNSAPLPPRLCYPRLDGVDLFSVVVEQP